MDLGNREFACTYICRVSDQNLENENLESQNLEFKISKMKISKVKISNSKSRKFKISKLKISKLQNLEPQNLETWNLEKSKSRMVIISNCQNLEFETSNSSVKINLYIRLCISLYASIFKDSHVFWLLFRVKVYHEDAILLARNYFCPHTD